MNKARSGAPVENGAPALQRVEGFWNTEACGSHFVRKPRATAEFYEEFRQFRYETEWHIPLLVPFTETKDKKVLEIGCGNGADGVMFALAGADYTGVDLTETAVAATRKHFEVLGLHGTFQLENAECLSFPYQSFDFVYSHGVLHHTADPQRAFREVHRVLKPGGQAVLMLYHKHSFNYYARIMGYMRLRVLMEVARHMTHHNRDRSQLREDLKGVRGNKDPSIWRLHYENFLKTGWTYLHATTFVHHATDGPECPIAYVFTRKQVADIFHEFSSVKTKVAHFPLRKYPLGKWIPRAIERKIASMMGWYLFVFLTR